MTWNKGLSLVVANKLFGKFDIEINFDTNTKIYTATLSDRSLQHVSVIGICELILANWFALK